MPIRVNPFTGDLYPDNGISNVVEDTTPQLGGSLDLNGQNITSGATTISPTEVTYLDGVTSAIQTQLNGKLSLSGGTLTGLTTFTGTGSGTTGAITTNHVTVKPNSGISTSASMFLDNNAGQVWEFYCNSVGKWGVYDKTASARRFEIALDGTSYFFGHSAPGTNNTYSSGTSSNYWLNTYTQTLHLNSTASISGATAGDATFTGSSWTFQDPASSSRLIFDYSGGIPRLFSGAASNVYFGDSGGYLDFAPAAASGSPKFSYKRVTSTSGSLFRVTAVGFTGSGSLESNRQYGFKIDPTINQSGGAHSSMLLIDPTVTALGTGTHYLADLRVGGTQKTTVSHAGDVEIHDSAAGVILKSPDGTRWRISVDNTGALTTATA